MAWLREHDKIKIASCFMWLMVSQQTLRSIHAMPKHGNNKADIDNKIRELLEANQGAIQYINYQGLYSFIRLETLMSLDLKSSIYTDEILAPLHLDKRQIASGTCTPEERDQVMDEIRRGLIFNNQQSSIYMIEPPFLRHGTPLMIIQTYGLLTWFDLSSKLNKMDRIAAMRNLFSEIGAQIHLMLQDSYNKANDITSQPSSLGRQTPPSSSLGPSSVTPPEDTASVVEFLDNDAHETSGSTTPNLEGAAHQEDVSNTSNSSVVISVTDPDIEKFKQIADDKQRYETIRAKIKDTGGVLNYIKQYGIATFFELTNLMNMVDFAQNLKVLIPNITATPAVPTKKPSLNFASLKLHDQSKRDEIVKTAIDSDGGPKQYLQKYGTFHFYRLLRQPISKALKNKITQTLITELELDSSLTQNLSSKAPEDSENPLKPGAPM